MCIRDSYNGAYYLAEFSPQERHVYKKNTANYDAANVFIDEIQKIYNAEANTCLLDTSFART